MIVRGLVLPLALLPILAISAFADILIGVAGPFTGQTAVFGEQMKAGAQAAVDLINAEGGINGERLAVVTGDDGCDARRAVGVAQEFVSKDVRAVIGHFCSGAALAAADVYGKADIVMIAPTASNPRLTDDDRWNVVRLATRDDAQADIAFTRISKDLPNAKIAVVTDGTPGTSAMVAKFSGALQIVIKPGNKSFPEAVAAISAGGIGAVYMACAGQEAGIVTAGLRDALVRVPIYGADSLLVDAYWEQAGATGEGTLVTFAADPAASPKAQRVLASMAATGKATDGAALPSYAAVQIFAAAAKAKSVNDGRAMADYLKSGVEFDTVLSAVRFNSKGDVSPSRLDWYQWSQGTYSRNVRP